MSERPIQIEGALEAVEAFRAEFATWNREERRRALRALNKKWRQEGKQPLAMSQLAKGMQR